MSCDMRLMCRLGSLWWWYVFVYADMTGGACADTTGGA